MAHKVSRQAQGRAWAALLLLVLAQVEVYSEVLLAEKEIALGLDMAQMSVATFATLPNAPQHLGDQAPIFWHVPQIP